MAISYNIRYLLDNTFVYGHSISVDSEISGVDPYIDDDEKTIKVMYSATLLDSYTFDTKVQYSNATVDNSLYIITCYVDTLSTYKFKHYSASAGGGGENPLIATTDDEMLALDIVANNGKIVKFTGTSSNYETNGYYLIENN